MSEEKIKHKKISIKSIIILVISITVISIIVLYLLGEKVESPEYFRVASLTDNFKLVTKLGCKTGAKSLDNIIEKKYKATFTCLGEIEDVNINDFYSTNLYSLPNNNVLFYTKQKAVIYNLETNKSLILTDDINKTASLIRINEIPSNMKDKYFITHYIIFDSITNEFYKLSEDRMKAYKTFIKERKDFRKNASLIKKFNNNTSLYGSQCEGFKFNNSMNGCKEIWLEDFTNLKRYKPVALKERKYGFSVLVLNNENILLIGGVSELNKIEYPSNNKTFNTIELYNPKNATLSSVGKINIPRCCFKSLLLKNENILIFGGRSTTTSPKIMAELNNIEIIDIKTYKSINNLSIDYYNEYEAIPLLNNDNILFIGENNFIYDFQKNELYNLRKSLTHRFNVKLLTLNNDKVLIYGGDLPPKFSLSLYKKNECVIYNSAELFTIEKAKK